MYHIFMNRTKTIKSMRKNKNTKFGPEKDTFALYTVYVRLTIEYQLAQNFYTDLLVQITLNQFAIE